MSKTFKYFCLAAGSSGLVSELSIFLRFQSVQRYGLGDVFSIVYYSWLICLGLFIINKESINQFTYFLTGKQAKIFEFYSQLFLAAMGVLVYLNVHSTAWMLTKA
jgi:hypothetical protein